MIEVCIGKHIFRQGYFTVQVQMQKFNHSSRLEPHGSIKHF